MTPRTPRDVLSELRKRGVPRAVAAYLIAGAAAVEVADIVVPRVGLPDWTVSLVVWLAVLGLPVAIWSSWAFDLEGGRVHRAPPAPDTEGPDDQSPTIPRAWLMASALVLTGLFALFLTFRPWAGDVRLLQTLPGARLQPLTPGDALDLNPSWSPDGASLAFGRAAGGTWTSS